MISSLKVITVEYAEKWEVVDVKRQQDSNGVVKLVVTRNGNKKRLILESLTS